MASRKLGKEGIERRQMGAPRQDCELGTCYGRMGGEYTRYWHILSILKLCRPKTEHESV